MNLGVFRMQKTTALVEMGTFVTDGNSWLAVGKQQPQLRLVEQKRLLSSGVILFYFIFREERLGFRMLFFSLIINSLN